jgi:hypothetical protein
VLGSTLAAGAGFSVPLLVAGGGALLAAGGVFAILRPRPSGGPNRR